MALIHGEISSGTTRDHVPIKASSTGQLNVAGPLTDAELRATAVPVSGPLTDTQLRATAVPVSGPVTDTQLRASPVAVSGPLTDTQLRAAPVITTPYQVVTTTLLNAVTVTGAGTSTAGTRTSTYQLNGFVSSSTGSAVVRIEGSNDNTNWNTIESLSLTLGTSTTTDFAYVEQPWAFVRANVATLTGTGATVSLIRGS